MANLVGLIAGLVTLAASSMGLIFLVDISGLERSVSGSTGRFIGYGIAGACLALAFEVGVEAKKFFIKRRSQKPDAHADLIQPRNRSAASAANWRQGFFRLWAVGSALLVIAVAGISYSEIKAQFAASTYKKWPGVLLVPQLCGNARGVVGEDFTTNLGQNPGPWDLYAKPKPSDACWYAMPKFRPLYPEFNNLSDEELSSKLYADSGIPLRNPPNPWATLLRYAAIAFGAPLIVLILGGALGWAFSGFKAKHQSNG